MVAVFCLPSAKGFRLPVINHSTTTEISEPFSKLWAKWLHFGYAVCFVFHEAVAMLIRAQQPAPAVNFWICLEEQSFSCTFCGSIPKAVLPAATRRFSSFFSTSSFRIPSASSAYYLHYNPSLIFGIRGGDACFCCGCCFRAEFFLLYITAPACSRCSRYFIFRRLNIAFVKHACKEMRMSQLLYKRKSSFSSCRHSYSSTCGFSIGARLGKKL